MWRHQYPPAQLADLTGEDRLATRLGVSWVPDIGPGLAEIPSTSRSPIVTSASPAQQTSVLVERFRPFVDAGAKMVIVSFDDTIKASSHSQDAAAYGTGDAAYGQMNADLLDRLAKPFSA